MQVHATKLAKSLIRRKFIFQITHIKILAYMRRFDSLNYINRLLLEQKISLICIFHPFPAQEAVDISCTKLFHFMIYTEYFSDKVAQARNSLPDNLNGFIYHLCKIWQSLHILSDSTTDLSNLKVVPKLCLTRSLRLSLNPLNSRLVLNIAGTLQFLSPSAISSRQMETRQLRLDD